MLGFNPLAPAQRLGYAKIMPRLLSAPFLGMCLSLVLVSQAAAADPPAPDSPPSPDEPRHLDDGPSAPPVPNDSPAAAESPADVRPAQPAPAIVAPEPRKGKPRLHIEADRPGVRLMKITRAMSDEMGEGILVKTVCTAPCDQIINAPKRQTYFFGADGMVPSRGFRLSPLEGDITARIHGGSIVARQMGFLFGGFGGAALLGGATMLGVGYAHNGTHLSNEGKVVEGPNPNLTTGGFIVLGVGAAMVTTAIVLVVTAKTRVTLIQGSPQSAGLTFEHGAFRF